MDDAAVNNNFVVGNFPFGRQLRILADTQNTAIVNIVGNLGVFSGNIKHGAVVNRHRPFSLDRTAEKQRFVDGQKSVIVNGAVIDAVLFQDQAFVFINMTVPLLINAFCIATPAALATSRPPSLTVVRPLPSIPRFRTSVPVS